MRRKNTFKMGLLFMVVLFTTIEIFAQIPYAVSFQSVIRDSNGDLVQSATVGVKISIQSKMIHNPFMDIYSETHTVVTNSNGLISLEVGRGTPVLGVFSDISWYSNKSTLYLKVETDPAGGTNYTTTGLSEILATPYSFLANEALTVKNEADPVFNVSVAKNITTADITKWNNIDLNNAYNASRYINAGKGPMEIIGTDGILVRGDYGFGTNLEIAGKGTRMLWFPKKAAFRAGSVFSDQWSESNLGNYSAAFGYSTLASGECATALGSSTKATGENSTAMGSGSQASGLCAIAMGGHNEASGEYSIAMGCRTIATTNAATAIGYYTEANGMASFAVGDSAYANGDASVALGYHTLASAQASTAMGAYTIASGLGSTAMGAFASTNEKSGSFVIGDISTYGTTNTKVSSSAANQMTMRFAGGYMFYTNSTTTTGVSLSAGGNSWASVSDSTKKENFQSVQGDYFLSSLSKLKLGSWNYKGQNSNLFRHYGPMAQEVFQYFGNDGVGVIGCDTTLAAADMDGIMMICLQALERRTSSLDEQNKKLAESNQLLEQRLAALENMVRQMTVLNEEKKNNVVAQKETE